MPTRPAPPRITTRKAMVITATFAAAAACTIGVIAEPAAQATAPLVAPAAASGAPAALRMAAAQAASADSPQAVDSMTDETSAVIAQPDGTFVMTTSREPVRAHTDDGWQLLDLNLHRTDNGSIAPGVSTQPLLFSGGGTGPAVTFGGGDNKVELTLPAALPTPTVSGPSATYAEIYPGVDLVLTAQSSGYTEVLVVKNATAATNPALKTLKFQLTTESMNVQRNPDGSIQTTDPDSGTTYTSSTPIMWDSDPANAYGPVATNRNPGSGTVTQVANSVQTTDSPTTDGQDATVTLSPPAAALAGSDVHYPVYIDPDMTGTRVSWASYFSSGHANYYNSTSENMMVGRCNWDGCNTITGVARSAFALRTPSLSGQATTAHVTAARVDVRQVWNANSAATPTHLYGVHGFSSAVAWPGPDRIKFLGQVSSAAGASGKNIANVTWNNNDVRDYFQYVANNNWTQAPFELISPIEDDKLGWKRFDVNPTATVYFNFAPSTPYGLNIGGDGFTCGSDSTFRTANPRPWLYATAKDNNPSGDGTPIGMDYEIWRDGDNNGPDVFGKRNNYHVTGTSGHSIGWYSFYSNSANTSNNDPLYNATWKFRARSTADASDSTDLVSAWSPWYTFVVDGTDPDAPTLVSTETNTITITNRGAAGFEWTNDPGSYPDPNHNGKPTCGATETYANGTKGVVSAGASGTATIRLDPTSGLQAGPVDIYIKTFDGVHNPSQAALKVRVVLQ